MALRILLAAWLATLACRVLVFGDGGTVGAYITVGLFWAVTAVLLALSVRQLILRGERQLEHGLVLGAVLAFLYRMIVDEGPTAPASALLFFVCLVALAVVYVRSVWLTGRGPNDPVSTAAGS